MSGLTIEPSGSEDSGVCDCCGLAKVAFDIVDAIWLQDDRIAEVVSETEPGLSD